MDDTFTYEHLPYRGLTKEVLKFYDMKTKIDSEGKPVAVGYTMPNGNIKVRKLDNKEFYWMPGSDLKTAGLFGMDKFEHSKFKYITITEGYEDAASIYQVTQGPAVSVHSAATAVNDVIVDRPKLNEYERIYLAFDSDAPGREATEKVARLFDPSKVFVVKFDRRKDANEYVVNGESDDLRKIWWASKQYLPRNIISSFSEFEREIFKPRPVGIPYPFPTLTKMTYGIRTGEGVLLTALEKVGKTELMHAFLYQLLRETDVPIGAFFLEESAQRTAQALGGIHLQKPVHLPDCGVGDVEVFDAFKEAVKVDDRLFCFNHFGSTDPSEFLDTVRFLVTARGCRYILLDHLSVILSGLQGEDERKALDFISTRLEMMLKELDFSLIVVSHVNDEGKTRGSRWMTKMFDITIGAFRDLQALDPIERRTIKLNVMYNRFCSNTGPAGNVWYNPETGTLTEINGVEELSQAQANDNDQSFDLPYRHGTKGLETFKAA